jgi:hypothetical protein
MKILYLYPPNFREIQRAFNVRGKPVLFAYGNAIYNPSRVHVPPELVIHETVHSERQGQDPKGWWGSYIADRGFRLEEEARAHSAENRHLLTTGRDHLELLAERLSSPLYGSLCDLETARKLIEKIWT